LDIIDQLSAFIRSLPKAIVQVIIFTFKQNRQTVNTSL